jgi:LPS sulfotransferase NodH
VERFGGRMEQITERLRRIRMNVRLLKHYWHGLTSRDKTNSFVLLGVMRSGTTLLGDLLEQHTDLTWRGEAFDQRVHYPVLYLRGVAREPLTSCVGVKIFTFQLSKRTEPPTKGYDQNDVDRGRRILDVLRVKNWKFVHLIREDAFAQCVSLVRATQTGIWHRTPDVRTGDSNKIRLDARQFERYLIAMMMYREYEQKVLSEVELLRLTYEADLYKSEAHQATADRTFGFLGLSAKVVSSRFLKLYGDPLDSQIENFDEVVRVARRLDVAPMYAGVAPRADR